MKQVQVLNLTPHSIEVISCDGTVTATFPPSGQVARCAMEFGDEAELFPGVPVGTVRYGEVSGLPSPKPGVWLLVSVIVRLACPDRHDLLVVANEVRDQSGRVVGCRGLARSVVTG